MPRMAKIFRFLLNVLCLFLISYVITRKSFNPLVKKKINRYLPDIKYMLLWTKIEGVEGTGQKPFIHKNCKHINCYLTTKKHMFGDIRYFDGIIFNLQDVSKGIQNLPLERAYHQKYIFAANDSSDNYPVCDPVYDNFFNWTWTYRSDSTIPYRFVSVYNHERDEIDNRMEINWKKNDLTVDDRIKKELTTKSMAATIFVDKCRSRSKREIFVMELMKQLEKYNMTIDVFGKCGKECRKKTMKPCLWKLKKYYFFYLALEDSFSEDYVTQVVLYAYKNNAVPIVYGKANYERFLPPHSYLDGQKLGVMHLAEVMYQTICDQNRYLHFFAWKNYYTVESSEPLDVCGLCSALNNPRWLTDSVSYIEFRKWWNPDFEKRCLMNKDPSYF